MAGAVAFVFGLCALSFAAGCVVTAVMLRRADPADEAPQPVTPPEPARPPTPGPTPRLVWPPDDFTAKPIHRNPVVGLPALASLDHGDPAPAALALAPDPTFTGVFDPPPSRLPDPVEESFDQPLEGEPPTASHTDPTVGRVLHARSTTNTYALRGRREPAPKRSPHAEQAILLKAACGPTPFDRAVQPITLRVVADLPQTESTEEPRSTEPVDAEPVAAESDDVESLSAGAADQPLLAEPGDDRVLLAGVVADRPLLAESDGDRVQFAGVADDRPLLAESSDAGLLSAELDDDRALSAESGDDRGLLAELHVDPVPPAAENVLPVELPGDESDHSVDLSADPDQLSVEQSVGVDVERSVDLIAHSEKVFADQQSGGESDRPIELESDSAAPSNADLDLPTLNLVTETKIPAQLAPEAPDEVAESEPVSVVPVRRTITGPVFPTARNGKRREIKLELVPQSESNPITESRTPEPEAVAPEAEAAALEVGAAPEVEAVEVEATDAETRSVVVPESETVFVSRSGLVTEPASDLTPESGAVVPEQGVKPEPVVPKQHLVPNDEFRKRYLRTFEAARRRSNH